MPKFKVMVADDQGHTLYDEWIEAAGPKEACAIAIADAGTADMIETEEPGCFDRLSLRRQWQRPSVDETREPPRSGSGNG